MSEFIKKISMSKCAPHLKSSSDKCFTLLQLKKIGKQLNKYLKKQNEKVIKLNQSKSKLWSELQKYFSSKCGDNSKCWLKQKGIKPDDEMKLYTFKPIMPEEWKKDKYTWLNSLDILYLMVLAEKMYKGFKFYGPVPSDCPVSVNCVLSKIDFNELLRKKKDKLGIIYNLDVSTGPGTHWTAVYIDIKNKNINYYDSYGQKPIPLINEFLKKIHKKLNNCKVNNNKSVVIYNDKQHQHGHSECGMFSMNFILHRLEGLSMFDIFKKNFTDKQMNDLRLQFYSH
jgi:hypothetical protein